MSSQTTKKQKYKELRSLLNKASALLDEAFVAHKTARLNKAPKHERIAAMMRENNCQYFFQHPEVYLISFDGGTNRTLICAFDDFECIRLQVELYREKGNE